MLKMACGLKLPKDTPEDFNAINQHIHNECILHMRRRNMLFLEAAISCMMDTDTAQDTARLLREHANQLEEYG